MDKLKSLLKNNLDSIIKPVVVLLAICIVIPFALAATNMITHERIEKLEIESRNTAMRALFKGADFTEETLGEGEDSVVYYKASSDGKVIGYIFTNTAKGYGGNESVSVMTAINIDGNIKAIKILDVSEETPGLGQNANKESFYSQFAGMDGEISINKTAADSAKNEIAPIAGATITSNAVKEAVNQALASFEAINQPKETEKEETEVSEDEK